MGRPCLRAQLRAARGGTARVGVSGEMRLGPISSWLTLGRLSAVLFGRAAVMRFGEASADEDAVLQEQLHGFLTGEAMTIVYQPVVDIRTGHVVGAEALARFSAEPRRGPDFWFEQAWRLGLGMELELEAIRRALQGLEEMPAGVYLAVNAAPNTLCSEKLLALVESVKSERIVVELTEHERVEDYEVMNQALSALRSRGARLSIDDAGAGFSSFQHVLRLRPDIIKLDRSLTTGVDSNPVRFALASALVTFAASLGSRVCAEGIETAAELVALQRLGVTKGQGYFLARPAPLPLPPPPAGFWTVLGRPSDRMRAAIASPAVRSQERLQAVTETAMLTGGAANQEAFDRLTRLVALVLRVPIALISLVGSERQVFRSAVGLGEVRETPLSHSLCQHVVTTRAPVRIDDVKSHPLVRDDPAVDELAIAAYAGAPIFAEQSQVLGALCAIDAQPRSWTDAEMQTLVELAHLVSEQIARERLERDREAQMAVLDLVFEHSNAITMLCDVQGGIVRASALLCELTGYSEQELLGRRTTEFWHSEDGMRAVVARNRLFSGEERVVRGSARFKHASGRWLRTVASAAIARVPDATACYTLVTFERLGDDASEDDSASASETIQKAAPATPRLVAQKLP
jgi:PAS domain S-box-containing protein